MDRPRRRPEPTEPNHCADQPPVPEAPVEPAALYSADKSPVSGDRTQQGNTEPVARTVEKRSTASVESGENATGSRWDDQQKDLADRSRARSANDAVGTMNKRDRDDAEKTAIPQRADDSTSTVRGGSDRLPASLREQMLQDPIFTRLGWGTDDDADSDQVDDSDPGDVGEEPEGPDRRGGGKEQKVAGASEPLAPNGNDATIDSDSHDSRTSPDEQTEDRSLTHVASTEETDRDNGPAADASNGSNGTTETSEASALDPEVNGETGGMLNRSDPVRLNPPRSSPADLSNTESEVDVKRVDQRSVDGATTVAALLDRRTVPDGREVPESPILASDADASAGVQAGLEEDQWTDPEKRRSWVEERLADPKHTKAVTSDEPWARYQRARVGDVEVELQTAEPDSTIWADGLEIDPDTVVVVEVKYVTRPDRSLYEGKVPARMLEVMLHPFDDEMERYASVVQHNANPVERIRLVTSTDAAARFLGERARKILGEDIDLDIQVWSEEER